MISRFYFAAQLRTGLMSKTLIVLSKNGFKPVKYFLDTDRSELVIDLKSDDGISLRDLDIVKSQLPDIELIRATHGNKEELEKHQGNKAESDVQPKEMFYRGQKVTENEPLNADADHDKIKKRAFTYRGTEIAETTNIEKEGSKAKNKSSKAVYRGQKIN